MPLPLKDNDKDGTESTLYTCVTLAPADPNTTTFITSFGI